MQSEKIPMWISEKDVFSYLSGIFFGFLHFAHDGKDFLK
jgi:hypothetical protein